MPVPRLVEDDEARDATADPVVRTLVMTDLVGSTRLVDRLGDTRAYEIATRHDRAARDLLSRWGGLEIDKTDGFLLLFERPVDGVAFTLAYHRALADLSRELGVALSARAGIHLGEVMLHENPPDDVARGAKRLEVEGIAKPTVARLASLASGGQTLLTQGAFDLARRSAVGAELPEQVSWLAHGAYVFKGVEEPLEIFEAGIVGLAPLAVPPDNEKAQRVVAAGDEATLGWRPAPDQRIPLRPNWVLEQRIGTGGFGEVWLAAHEKTHEKRVFKFCLEANRLRSLKREITLFRLLKEALGHRDDIARVLDCNFDEAPYFLESEYTEGGNLAEWAEEQGGLSEVPLETRLELVAQVAEALAAAHSVGVLHKDVKPANVLVSRDHRGRPKAQLTDFGISRLIDESVLSDHGITLMGMTEVLPSGEESITGGTYLYMAPEVLEGKVATVQADLYALGVLLYQMIAGSFTHPLSPGWRRDVPDEVLAGDVARLVDGSPDHRPASAAEVADGLRRLDERRAKLSAKRAREKAQRRWKLAGSVGALTSVVLVIVSILAVQATRARREADLRRGQAEDLISFMLQDLRAKLEPLGKLEILNEVGDQAVAYFASVPEQDLTPGELLRHSEALTQIGDVRIQLGDLPAAMRAFQDARELAHELVERDPDNAAWQAGLGAAHFWSGHVLWRQGELDGALEELRQYLAISERLVAKDPDNLGWQLELAYAHSSLGTILEARGELDAALAAFQKARTLFLRLMETDPENTDRRLELADAHNKIGHVLAAMGDLEGALEHYRQELSVKQALVAEDPEHANWRYRLAVGHNHVGNALKALDDLELAMTHFEEGASIMAALTERDPSNSRWRRELATAHGRIADTLLAQGRLDEAWNRSREYLAIMKVLVASDSSDSRWRSDLGMAHFRMGEILEARGDVNGAFAAASAAGEILEALAAENPGDRTALRYLSSIYTLRGRLWAARGELEQARATWSRASAIIEPLARDSNDKLFLVPWARALLYLDRIEAARPIVEKLSGLGYRDREFLELCRLRGLKAGPKTDRSEIGRD